MAGDWIKMRHALTYDPAVVALAAQVNLDEFGIVGRLHAVWSWLDQHSEDGTNVRISSAFLDRLTACPGFADALRAVGWLSGRDSALTFPGYTEHNGETAKHRASEAKRKAEQREAAARPDTARDVCPACDGTSVPHVAGPEKRREDTNPPSPPAPQGGNGQKPMSDRRNRSTARRVRAREVIDGRLKTLRNEWDDIMHPGGSACAVVPKDGTSKAQRLQAMTAEIDSLERERKELQECSK